MPLVRTRRPGTPTELTRGSSEITVRPATNGIKEGMYNEQRQLDGRDDMTVEMDPSRIFIEA